MSRRTCLPVCAVVAGMLTLPFFGQDLSIPPAGDPKVFGLFLHYHDLVMRDVEALRSKNPQEAQSFQQRIAASFSLTAADFGTVNTIYRGMKAQFDALDAEAAVYTNNGRRRDVSMSVLIQFETRHQKILADGLKRIQTSLSPADWSAFAGFVDGEYRKNVRRGSAVGVVPPGTTGQVRIAAPPN